MQFQTQSGPTTIPPVGIGIDTADTSLTINGDLNLKDNATIFSNSGEVSLGELDIESGRVIAVGNTKLNLAGGKVGAEGEIRAPTTGPANLKLLGDLTVEGIFGVAASVTLDLSGKTIDASGGELHLGGTRTLDKIITDADTTLKVLGSAGLSRADSGTSKVGDLQFLQLGNHPSRLLSVSGGMGLTVSGTAEINGYNISHDNGSLTFLSTPSLSNSGSLSVSNGELVLQKGGTFDNSSVNLTTSVFKPTGTVSVTNGGSFNLNNTSSVVLQGDTTLSQSGTASWPELDLGGKKLTTFPIGPAAAAEI